MKSFSQLSIISCLDEMERRDQQVLSITGNKPLQVTHHGAHPEDAEQQSKQRVMNLKHVLSYFLPHVFIVLMASVRISLN